MAQSAPAIVFGSAPIARYSTETAKEMLEILEKHKVNQIDTASIYVSSHCSRLVVMQGSDFPAARQRIGPRKAGRSEEVHYPDQSSWIQAWSARETEHSRWHEEEFRGSANRQCMHAETSRSYRVLIEISRSTFTIFMLPTPPRQLKIRLPVSRNCMQQESSREYEHPP